MSNSLSREGLPRFRSGSNIYATKLNRWVRAWRPSLCMLRWCGLFHPPSHMPILSVCTVSLRGGGLIPGTWAVVPQAIEMYLMVSPAVSLGRRQPDWLAPERGELVQVWFMYALVMTRAHLHTPFTMRIDGDRTTQWTFYGQAQVFTIAGARGEMRRPVRNSTLVIRSTSMRPPKSVVRKSLGLYLVNNRSN